MEALQSMFVRFISLCMHERTFVSDFTDWAELCPRSKLCQIISVFSYSNIFKNMKSFFRFLFSFDQNNCCDLDEQRFGLWQQQSAGLCHPSPHFVHSPPIQHYLVYIYIQGLAKTMFWGLMDVKLKAFTEFQYTWKLWQCCRRQYQIM